MTRWNAAQRERAMELAAGLAVGALSEQESREVAELEREAEFETLRDDLALAAAAVDVGSWKPRGDMPEDLRSRLMAAGEAWTTQRRGTTSGAKASSAVEVTASRASRESSNVAGVIGRVRDGASQGGPAVVHSGGRNGAWVSRAGWLAAAAALALAAIGWWPRLAGLGRGQASGNAPTVQLTSSVVLADLKAKAGDVQRLAWSRGTDASAIATEGEVIWSPALQKGYMVFRGLRVNDPTVEQYQLWIFDAERDERYPVDGGLFDVPIGCQELVVPITPKLGVPKASTFVLTVEKPGGVWVSDRSRIAAIAKRS